MSYSIKLTQIQKSSLVQEDKSQEILNNLLSTQKVEGQYIVKGWLPKQLNDYDNWIANSIALLSYQKKLQQAYQQKEDLQLIDKLTRFIQVIQLKRFPNIDLNCDMDQITSKAKKQTIPQFEETKIFKLQKIGKKFNGNKMRDVTINFDNVDKFIKNGKKFMPLADQATIDTKQNPSKDLAWQQNVNDCEYRVLLKYSTRKFPVAIYVIGFQTARIIRDFIIVQVALKKLNKDKVISTMKENQFQNNLVQKMMKAIRFNKQFNLLQNCMIIKSVNRASLSNLLDQIHVKIIRKAKQLNILNIFNQKRKKIIANSSILSQLDKNNFIILYSKLKILSKEIFIKQQQIDLKKFSVELIQLEIRTEIDLLNPYLIVRLKRDSKSKQKKRIVNGKIYDNNDEYYYEQRFDAAIKCNQGNSLVWVLDYHEINITEFDNFDTFEIKLQDEIIQSTQWVLITNLNKIFLNEIELFHLSLKNNELNEDLLPILSMKIKKDQILHNVDDNFENHFLKKVKCKHELFDPIYQEQIEIPEFTPKYIRFLKDLFDQKNNPDLNLYQLDNTKSEQNYLVSKAIVNYYYLNQCSKQNNKLDQQQYLVDQMIQQLEEFLKSQLISKKNTGLNIEWNLILDMVLNHSPIKNYNIYETVKKICENGIPNKNRIKFWEVLGRKDKMMEMTQKALNQSFKLHEYVKNDITLQYDEKLSIYENLIKISQQKLSVSKLEIQNDLASIAIDVEQSKQCEFKQNLFNILQNYAVWCEIIGQFITDDFQLKLTYSRSVMKLTKKILLFVNSQFTGPQNEETTFWIITIMTSVVLRSYYDVSPESQNDDSSNSSSQKDNIIEKAVKNQQFSKFPLQNFNIQGLKLDLLFLRVLIKDNFPSIYHKTLEIGFSIEFFFAESFLNMGVDLFNCQLLYRIFDFAFYQSSTYQFQQYYSIFLDYNLSSTQNSVASNAVVIASILTLIQHSQKSLEKAQTIQEFILFIKMFGKLTFDNDKFFESYKFYLQKCLDNLQFNSYIWHQSREELETIKENSIQKHILMDCFMRQQTPFVSESNIQLNDIKEFIQYEKNLKINKKVTLTQFQELNSSYYLSNSQEPHKFTFNQIIQKEKISDESQILNALKNQQEKILLNINENINYMKESKSQQLQSQSYIQLFIHKLTLQVDMSNLFFQLEYPSSLYQPVSIPLNSEMYLNIYEQFQKTICQEIKISIYQKKQSQIRVLKTGVINLQHLLINQLHNMRIFLKEQFQESFVHNVSFIDVSILIHNRSVNYHKKNLQHQGLFLDKLKSTIFKFNYFPNINSLNIEDLYTKMQQSMQSNIDMSNVLSSSQYINSSNWRKNSVIKYEEFLSLQDKDLKLFKKNSDMALLYNAFSSKTKDFSMKEFTIFACLLCEASTLQRLYSIYEIITHYDGSDKISIYSLKQLCYYLADIFLLPVSKIQLENSLEYIIYGESDSILKASLYSFDFKKQLDITKIIRFHCQQTQKLYGCKDLILGTATKLNLVGQLIQENFQEDVLSNIFNNTDECVILEIKYVNQGQKQIYRVMVNKYWKIIRKIEMNLNKSDIQSPIPQKNKATEINMFNNENVICLNDWQNQVDFEQFQKIMGQMELFNYLFSFENLKNNQNTLQINHRLRSKDSLEIKVNNEHLMMFRLSDNNNQLKVLNQRQLLDLKFKWNILRQDKLAQLSTQQIVNREKLQQNLEFELENINKLQKLRDLIECILANMMSSIMNLVQDNRYLWYLNSDIFAIDIEAPAYEIKILSKESQLNLENMSLYELIQLNPTNPMKLVINFKDRQNYYQSLIHKSSIVKGILQKECIQLDQEFNQIAKLKYSQQFRNWSPCKIVARYNTSTENKQYSQYLGVQFKDHPCIFIKQQKDIIFAKQFDLQEIAESDLDIQKYEIQGTQDEIQCIYYILKFIQITDIQLIINKLYYIQIQLNHSLELQIFILHTSSNRIQKQNGHQMDH